VYTQRHNRLKQTDGPLFRGRYKAILVDQDSYLLQLSRYIHRNPIDMQRPMVEALEDYPWSSYPAYINKAKAPRWLAKDNTYQMLGVRQRFNGYKRYVMQGVDDETLSFYKRGNQAAVLGDPIFREWVYNELLPELKAEDKAVVVQPAISIDAVLQGVAAYYRVSIDGIRQVRKGPNAGSEPRKVAMYLCQELSAAKLVDIASYFGLGHIGSVSFITHQVRKRKAEDVKYMKILELIIISIVKKAT
ncbi:MAG: hypothetical protein JKY01_01805, partial [Pseudomonadales bacterium]|nr:hypothetical protein [Pseudomonadales bacterium]